DFGLKPPQSTMLCVRSPGEVVAKRSPVLARCRQ
ncbi:hypothetical protein A2U01_0119194, partial [Trifolium medium]|nr:hypothetical protein [Trifolium medium]